MISRWVVSRLPGTHPPLFFRYLHCSSFIYQRLYAAIQCTGVAVARGKPIAVMPLDNQINSVAGTLYKRDGRLVKNKGYALLLIDPRLGQDLELTRLWPEVVSKSEISPGPSHKYLQNTAPTSCRGILFTPCMQEHKNAITIREYHLH